MTNRLDKELQFHQTALNLRAYRQQLLSSNIANADTPNYKARDIDFSKALTGALNMRLGPVALATTSAGHIDSAPASPFDSMAQYRTETQSSVDGNTVDMNTERAAFAENALHYEASITFINGLLRSMQTAVQGQ
ncbi:flagellar basal body rod protein FlgB [Nitrogeniibacter mangrovi]|uniref:Flagellar basal body rod protein FlgB n=1 Tax=Nitrogeniibacter mangrovi TaxID=2016596 RepID=A0A6C1B3Y8_9RHOO|nr:flagellar basal body rod protein FlgB [Nitrogeniibacter mangrovi]QID18382.1 flagellar basal body rod protein FlgB [Nitrogeniibacter mangrovi]